MERYGAALSGVEMDALKADERVDGAIGLRGFEVGLDDLVAGEGARVGDGDGGGERVTGGEFVR